MYRMIIFTLLAALLMDDLGADPYLDLAHKFSPILVLTEVTSDEFGDISIIKPEPVKIMDAESADSLRIQVKTLSKVLGDFDWRSINSDSWNPSLFPEVDFSQNRFAFLGGGKYFGSPFLEGGLQPIGNYIISPYFNYPGTTPALWDSVYFGKGRFANHAKRGSNFNNTAYVHIFDCDDCGWNGYNGSIKVIQYFYFYPYNNWYNKHEGDWQKINVIINPQSVTVLGVEYFFHGAHLSYYDNYVITSEVPPGVGNTGGGTITEKKPDLTSNFVFNPRKKIKLIQGTHPVVYVGAGSQAAYPTGGSWHIFRYQDPISDKWESMTHTGKVLRTQIDDSSPSLQENYDLVLLPKPDPDIRPNMGLPDTMSWLGAGN